MTEDREHAVALGRPDVTFIAFDGVQHLLSIPSHDRPVRLGLDLGREHGRIDEIAEQDREPTYLTDTDGGGEEVLRLGVAGIHGKHLTGELVGHGAVAAVDRLRGAIEQSIYRR
jgi:hypothetical protein